MADFDLTQDEARDTLARRAPYCMDPTSATILIADDSPVERKVLEMALQQLEWPANVIFAADGEEAWQKLLSAHPPVLVLTDLDMPHLDGIRLLLRIRGEPATSAVPTFVVTSSAQRIDVQEAMAAGATGVFPKPIEAHHVLALAKVVHAFAFHHCFTQAPPG